MPLSIKRVVPLESFKLIIEFDDGSFRQFPSARVADTPLWFLAFPLKLRACDVTPGAMSWTALDKTQMWDGQNVWEQEASLDVPALLEWSETVDFADLKTATLTLGMENRAPTEQDQRHHVYTVSIRPFCDDKWLVLGESIGGGFAERGGSVAPTLDSIDTFGDWKRHCQLAGCDWVVPFFLRVDMDHAERVDDILRAYRNRLP